MPCEITYFNLVFISILQVLGEMDPIVSPKLITMFSVQRLMLLSTQKINTIDLKFKTYIGYADHKFLSDDLFLHNIKCVVHVLYLFRLCF